MVDLSALPEAFVSTPELAKTISREVKRGALRKLGSRLYTRNLSDEASAVVRRNLWPIVAGLVPGALIADRTALENRPAPDGSVFVIAARARDLVLPGLMIRPRRGPPALPGDAPFLAGLRLSSTARAYLENMRPSRARKGVARTMPRAEIERRLETELQARGEAGLNRIRDDAREIAEVLGLHEEFRALDRLIGALLGTRADDVSAASAVARAAGRPYDERRVALLASLHAHLRSVSAPERPASPSAGLALPFFEAYFSNFIEGTEFAVDEAEDIVFRGHIPKNRPEDAHDILGTWRIVSNDAEMTRVPRSFDELTALLSSRHAAIMAGRPAARGGLFKVEPNRAGSTVFVAPGLVRGTLEKGFEILGSLEHPFHRAVFMMFFVAEVHPFSDGNGRTARIMMNAELVAARQTRIVVPTVFRNNYLTSLRLMSQHGEAAALVRTLDFAQRFAAALDFSTVERARGMLEKTNAFVPADEAEERGVRLHMPDWG